MFHYLSKPFQGSHGNVLGTLFFNIFINDPYNVIKHYKYLLFVDDINIFHGINSADDHILLQTDTECIQSLSITTFMKLNISKTRVTTFTRKTNVLYYTYKLWEFSTTCTHTIKDLRVQIFSKINFHAHKDYIFSQSIRMLGFICTLTYSFSTVCQVINIVFNSS
jgi:hypothetical protein